MIPFYVMLVAIVVGRLLGAFVWLALDGWHAATRVGLATMFIFTGVAHFARTRQDLVRMVPPQFPKPAGLVALTGVAELAGAVGLLVPVLARIAAYALIALLLAMFPANIYAARIGHVIAGRRHTRLLFRLPLQVLWIFLLWWSVQPAPKWLAP